jgi:hypothetical protein
MVLYVPTGGFPVSPTANLLVFFWIFNSFTKDWEEAIREGEI